MSFGLQLLLPASLALSGLGSGELKVDLGSVYHPVSGMVTVDQAGTASFVGSPATIIASTEAGEPPLSLEWRIQSPTRQSGVRDDLIEYSLAAKSSDGKVGLYAKKKPGSILYSTPGAYRVSLQIPGASTSIYEREFRCVTGRSGYVAPEQYQPPAIARLTVHPSSTGRGAQFRLTNDVPEIEAFWKGKLKYRWLSGGSNLLISGTNLSATVDASWLSRMRVVGQPLPAGVAAHYQKLQELESGRWFGWQPTGVAPGMVVIQSELDGVPHRRFVFNLNDPAGWGFQSLTPSVHDSAKLSQQPSQPQFLGTLQSGSQQTPPGSLFNSQPATPPSREDDSTKWVASVSSVIGKGYRFWITKDSPSALPSRILGYLPFSEEEASHVLPKASNKESFLFAGPHAHTYLIVERCVPWASEYQLNGNGASNFSVSQAKPLFYATNFDDKGIYDPSKYTVAPTFGPIRSSDTGTPVTSPGTSHSVRRVPQTYIPFEKAQFKIEKSGNYASFGYVENAFPVDCYGTTSFASTFDPQKLGHDRLSFTLIRRDISSRTPLARAQVGERKVRNPLLPGMGDYLLYIPTSAVGKSAPQVIVNFSTRQLRLIGKQYADANGAILVCGFSPENALFTDIFRYRDALITHVTETLPVTQNSVIWTGLSGGANIAGNSAIAFPYLTRGAIPIGSPADFAAGAFSITTPVVNFHGNRDSLNGLGHSGIQIKLGKNWANITYQGGHVWPSESEFSGALTKLNSMPAPRLDRSW